MHQKKEDSLSDKIIGNLGYGNRLNTELNKLIDDSGYYKFMDNRFPYLVSSSCYWTNSKYDDTHTFAFDKIDAYTSKLYNRANDLIDEKCKVVPVIKIKK